MGAESYVHIVVPTDWTGYGTWLHRLHRSDCHNSPRPRNMWTAGLSLAVRSIDHPVWAKAMVDGRWQVEFLHASTGECEQAEQDAGWARQGARLIGQACPLSHSDQTT